MSSTTTSVPITQELYYLLHLDGKVNAVSAVDRGLATTAFERVAASLGISERHLAELLRIKPSTLARRKREGSLAVDESERLYRIAFLLERSIQVMGDLDAARRWLQTSKRGLDGKSPLVFARTEPGAREVEDLLGRVEYGLPS